MIHAVPAYLFPSTPITFTRAIALQGVTVCGYTEDLARHINEQAAKLPVDPGFGPTHLIVIDDARYWVGLRRRLIEDNIHLDEADPQYTDLGGLVRQVLLSLTILGGVGWTFGGVYSFERYLGGRSPYRPSSYGHRRTVDMSGPVRQSLAPRTTRRITPRRLRAMMRKIDRYFRSGTWWSDRMGTALGYIWSSLTSSHPELTYAGLTMALEALLSTSSFEITHTLAERSALLVAPAGLKRAEAYKKSKKLYSLRSKIVHGRSEPKKGRLTNETLAITAKSSHVPQSSLAGLLELTLDVVEGVLRSHSLLRLLHSRLSPNKVDEALDAYFTSRLMGT